MDKKLQGTSVQLEESSPAQSSCKIRFLRQQEHSNGGRKNQLSKGKSEEAWASFNGTETMLVLDSVTGAV